LALRGGEAKYLVGGAPHHTSTFQHQYRDYPLRKGEFYMIDSLGTLNHYHGDFGRTVAWGEPPAKVQRRYDAMRAGLFEGLAACKPGVPFADVSKVIVETARKNGFAEFMGGAPHSVGLEHTDSPRVQGLVMQANMTLNFDIVYMELGFGALHLEDTFLVRDTHVELLTSGENELIVLD
jgi:Xaa-Pro dipeptidase